jgi:hypothetical protein
MRFRPAAAALAFAVLASCGLAEKSNDPGPAPAADHQDLVRSAMGEVLARRPPPHGTATKFRFAAPVNDAIARRHFDREIEGQAYEFGSVNGWKVEFWYTPEYDGYPPQPEHHQMAFFGGGQLRAIFSEGCGDTPFGLDQWSADWVDANWHPLPDKRTKHASSR